MSLHVCEFEFVQDGDYVLCWPFWPGREDGTQGEDFDDAVEMSVDWLREMALDYEMRGENLPKFPLGNEPQRGGRIVTIAVEASLSDVPAVTAKEAAGLLGVSGARVSQLCKAGHLDSWTVGRTRMVSLESVRLRLTEECRAGRPYGSKSHSQTSKKGDRAGGTTLDTKAVLPSHKVTYVYYRPEDLDCETGITSLTWIREGNETEVSSNKSRLCLIQGGEAA